MYAVSGNDTYRILTGVVVETEAEVNVMRPREEPRYRGQGMPEPFSTKNLSLQFSVQDDATDQDIQILTDRRYEGIPIVSQSFVARGGLQVWEGPEVHVEMMQGSAFVFKQYALLSVVYQCKGYYGKVAIASDQSPFYEANGWVKRNPTVVPDLVFTQSFLRPENLNNLN